MKAIIKWNTVFMPVIDTIYSLWISKKQFEQSRWIYSMQLFCFLPCLASWATIIATLHETWLQLILGESNNLILLNTTRQMAAVPY